MLTAKEISARLASSAEDVCRRLLPNGRKESGNWCVGSTAGEAGGSLRIQCSGSKAGVWADFASGAEKEKGDLLDLIAAVRNVTLGQAIKIAKEEFLGIKEPANQHVPKKKYFVPKFDGQIKIKENPDTAVERYMTQERKITKETLLEFRIAQYEHPTHGTCIAYPSKSADDKWVAVKWIALKRTPEGKKIISSPFAVEGGQPVSQAPCLFGWQVFPKEARVAIICEGQIDAMTWHQWTNGTVNALSIPNGVGDPTWIDYEWENLLRFDTIYLSFDMDAAGKEAVEIVARRLGIHRCMIVKLPHNDANECLQKGCTFADAARWLAEAKAVSPQEIKAPIDFKERILARYNDDPEVKKPGLEIPELRGKVRFLPGEVTLWTGYSSHGKSSFLNQVALYAAMDGQGVAIGSFEVKGDRTVEKLAKCLAYANDLPEPLLDQCLQWMSGKIWVYDVFGIISKAKLWELMLYSVMRHGVKHIVVDSLMKCELSSEDYEAQRKFMNEFIGFCEEHDIHGHLVAHPKKSDDDSRAPDIMDVHGGQAVSGQPARIASVWRNLKKNDLLESKKIKEEDADKHPDAYLHIQKDREYGARLRVPMWYTKPRERFTHNTEGGHPYYANFGIIH